MVSCTPISLTVSMSGVDRSKRVSGRHFATAQQPHSKISSLIQKFCLQSRGKLITQQEGIPVYKVINGTYLLNDFLNHGDVKHQIQLINDGDLRTQ